MERYQRLQLLPQIRTDGMARLSQSRAIVVGLGALGGTISEQLVRSGIGQITIIDRDIVEISNLQRQVLFNETDARDKRPKAIAAAERLKSINSDIKIDAFVTDINSENIEKWVKTHRPDVLLDGTDNVETRYLINDVSIKLGIPWIYGACVGTEGRVMPVLPGRSACLRCIFPTPPAPGELPTCDTAGVLGPVASVVASIQAVLAIQLLSGVHEQIVEQMTVLELWSGRIKTISTADARRQDCRCCGQNKYDYLSNTTQTAVSLCGRNSVQVRTGNMISLDELANRLSKIFSVEQTMYLVRCEVEKEITLTIFSDGRAIVQGIHDLGRARAIVAKYVGG